MLALLVATTRPSVLLRRAKQVRGVALPWVLGSTLGSLVPLGGCVSVPDYRLHDSGVGASGGGLGSGGATPTTGGEAGGGSATGSGGAPPGTTPGTCPKDMAALPAGSFWMGSEDGYSDETPVHQVAVEAFCMDTTEVTVGAWSACVRDGACPPASTTLSTPPEDDEDRKLGSTCNGGKAERASHPLNCVSWRQARTFCSARGKRLPTEEEWEYAARSAGRGQTYPWGDEPPGPRRVNGCDRDCVSWANTGVDLGWSPLDGMSDGFATTAPVGSFPDGATAQGLLDMAGNVWEWTESGYSTTYDSPRDAGGYVNRGGGWASDTPGRFRTTLRDTDGPDYRGYSLGFRCAR